MTTRSIAGGVIGWTVEIGSGSFVMIEEISEAWLTPAKAFFPVAISYSTAPSANMSVLVSASLPSSCSGAMYWKVPRIVPSAVRLALGGREAGEPATDRSARELCQAEVEQLHTRLGQHDVARLQVPMHDPLPMRAVERVGDLDPVTQSLVER